MNDKVNQDDINKALWAACDTFRGGAMHTRFVESFIQESTQ